MSAAFGASVLIGCDADSRQSDGQSDYEKAQTAAIELAKNAQTLDRRLIVVPFGAPQSSVPQWLTNQQEIRRQLHYKKGDLRIIGWQAILAEAKPKFGVRRGLERNPWFDKWLVWYGIELNGENEAWPFEVNLAGNVVRYVLGDEVLEKKYGWSQGHDKGAKKERP